MKREQTRPIKVANLQIGGQNKVLIQSMTNTKTKDVDSTVKQILDLENAGCEIVRVSVPDIDSAIAIEKIKKKIRETILIPAIVSSPYGFERKFNKMAATLLKPCLIRLGAPVEIMFPTSL